MKLSYFSLLMLSAIALAMPTTSDSEEIEVTQGCKPLGGHVSKQASTSNENRY
jgi:hypothetical protein